jgi:hypothetical protein
MKAPTHITAGRTAIRALLVAVVLTAGIVGTAGTAVAEPMDGMGDDPYPDDLYTSLDGKGNDVLYESLDGKGNDVYPPPARHSLGWIGDGAVTSAFPIDNVTASGDYAGRGGGSGKASL